MIAIAVLLLIMNWFFHRVDWSEWIGRFHRRCSGSRAYGPRGLADHGPARDHAGARRGAVLGGLWLGVFPTWETVGTQVVAFAFVIGSYVVAQEVKVKRPRRRAGSAPDREHATV